MISIENFKNKYKTIEDFIKKHPIGQKFRYIDYDLWHIVTYFKDNRDFVVIKSWSKYKRRWCYKVEDVITFDWTLDLCEREFKD